MFKEIEQAVLGNLEWLFSRVRSLSVKLVGFVVMCWLVIGVVGIGLVLPVTFVIGKMDKGNQDGRVLGNSGQGGVGSYQVYSAKNRLNLGQVRNSGSGQGYTQIKNEMQRANDSVNELRRFGKGIESLISR